MQERDWVELIGLFILGVLVGIGFMSSLRNYNLRELWRLKEQLAEERQALWEDLRRAQ